MVEDLKKLSNGTLCCSQIDGVVIDCKPRKVQYTFTSDVYAGKKSRILLFFFVFNAY